MSGNKRVVYSNLDREIFKEALKKYASVIENKKTDGATLKDKENAWRNVTKDFNSASNVSVKRTTAQLKKLWSNMKHVVREQLTRERQARLATGGGLPPATEEVDPDILNIAPHLMVTVPVLIDSDSTPSEVEDGRVATLNMTGSSNSTIVNEAEEVLFDGLLPNINVNHVVDDPTTSSSSSNVEDCFQQPQSVTSAVSDSSAKEARHTPSPVSSASKAVKRKRIDPDCVSRAALLAEEGDLRLQRQKKLIEQDEELFYLKKARAEEELETARLQRKLVALQVAELERRMDCDDVP